MLFTVAAMAAEMERDLIRERTMDGLRAAQAQGRRGGRPAAVSDDVLAIARARRERGEPVTSDSQGPRPRAPGYPGRPERTRRAGPGGRKATIARCEIAPRSSSSVLPPQLVAGTKRDAKAV